MYNQSGDLAYLGAAAVTVKKAKPPSVELPSWQLPAH